jgi:hypothetical protein
MSIAQILGQFDVEMGNTRKGSGSRAFGESRFEAASRIGKSGWLRGPMWRILLGG